eukprot:2274461-Pyramimonas_sp.AAC.1
MDVAMPKGCSSWKTPQNPSQICQLNIWQLGPGVKICRQLKRLLMVCGPDRCPRIKTLISTL